MSNDIRRYLDGESGLDELAPEVRGEAQAWDRMLDTFRVGEASGSAPPWLEDRIMAEIEALPAPGRVRRMFEWLIRPQPLRVSPGLVGLAAAAVAAVALFPKGQTTSPAAVGEGPQADAVVYVQFNLAAPGARTVSVGGDFDGWSGSHALEDPDGDGVWTGRVPVEPGLHSYMFLLDGSQWVTDPQASRYSDDGFGNQNAILAVAAPAA